MLLDQLAAARTFSEAAAVTGALGRVGNRRHLERLAELAKDRSRHGALRGFAVTALGMIAERSEQRWNEPIARDPPLTLGLTVLEEVLSID